MLVLNEAETRAALPWGDLIDGTADNVSRRLRNAGAPSS